MNKTVLLLGVLVVIAAGALALPTERDEWNNEIFDESRAMAVEFNATAPTVSRSEVMSRAKQWVTQKIPYCQCNGPLECCGSCPYCSTHRCDCSGYVSWCWKLPYGYTTRSLDQVSRRIDKSQLQPGDMLLNAGSHVILFGGWADSGKTTYHAYQEPGCHNSGPHYAYASVQKYPSSNYVPYRYNSIQ